MSTPVVINGVTYHIPAYNEVGWAQGSGNLSSFLVVVGNIASARRLDGTNYSSYVANSGAISSTGTTDLFDVTSLSLGAGVWSLSGTISFSLGAASSVQAVYGAIGTSAGNSSSGLTLGNNYFAQMPPTASGDSSLCIPDVIQSLAVTTTLYLKTRMDFAGSSPTSYGRITAIQIG